MAQHQVGSVDADGFTNKQRATAGSVAKSNGNLGTPANYDNMTAIDARLTAISSTTFTQSRLDSMTLNDKIYALRVQDDPTTI